MRVVLVGAMLEAYDYALPVHYEKLVLAAVQRRGKKLCVINLRLVYNHGQGFPFVSTLGVFTTISLVAVSGLDCQQLTTTPLPPSSLCLCRVRDTLRTSHVPIRGST